MCKILILSHQIRLLPKKNITLRPKGQNFSYFYNLLADEYSVHNSRFEYDLVIQIVINNYCVQFFMDHNGWSTYTFINVSQSQLFEFYLHLLYNNDVTLIK